MGEIIALHSYRGGTGKTNVTTSLAVRLAAQGYQVGVVDIDIQSPGIHALFDLDPSEFKATLNDVLWGRTRMLDAVHDVTNRVRSADGERALDGDGAVFLVPSSIDAADIARIIKEGYEVEDLNTALIAFLEDQGLDYLILDTHPGLSQEALLAMALSDVLIVMLRPDKQDYQGTAVTLDVAHRLAVPQVFLALNKVLLTEDDEALTLEVESAYDVPVAAVIPLDETVVRLGSTGVFAAMFPDSTVTGALDQLRNKLVNNTAPAD
ncbi:MAG: MinD/ParA family protein [Pseudomonadota bacterium]